MAELVAKEVKESRQRACVTIQFAACCHVSVDDVENKVEAERGGQKCQILVKHTKKYMSFVSDTTGCNAAKTRNTNNNSKNSVWAFG